jgi:hypothetical protein
VPAGQALDVTIPFTAMASGLLALRDAGFPAGTTAGAALETGSLAEASQFFAQPLPVGTYALREYRCGATYCYTGPTGGTNGVLLRQTQVTIARGEITQYTIQN